MKRVYLSLGSNLGDRERNLREALRRLAGAGIRVLRVSSLYETEPRDLRSQPEFLNVVVEAETELFPMQLLHRAQRIEQAMGRRKLLPKGPRIIDIDIVLYGNAVVSTDTLAIPHASMHRRRFVLEPLAELAPELRHPVTRATVRQMLAAVVEQEVKKIAGQDWAGPAPQTGPP